MNRELKERFTLNSRRKLYKKRIKDNELVEIGWINKHKRNCFHRPLKVVVKSEADNANYSTYYPGAFTTNDKDELVTIDVFNCSYEIYLNQKEVVGWSNDFTKYNFYYDDYLGTAKVYD